MYSGLAGIDFLLDELFANSLDLVTNVDDLHCALEKPIGYSGVNGRAIAVRAANHDLLQQADIDFAINIASMQKMNSSLASVLWKTLIWKWL